MSSYNRYRPSVYFLNPVLLFRFLFLCLALGLYAVSGSPTPDNPSWVEGLIAVSLFVFVMPFFMRRIFVQGFQDYPLWHLSLWALFVYGLTLPLVAGLYRGADTIFILRDVIGFIFLCLPLFLYDALKEKPNVGDPASFAPAFFLTALLGVAFVFALRVLWPDLPIFSGTVELLYLANSPLVMMGGLYLCMLSALYLYQKLTLKSVLCALSCLLVALIFWMAMAQDVQRAPFVALGLSIILLGVIGMVRAPRRMVGPVLFGSLLTVLIVYAGFDILEKIIHKTTHMGLNMRLQELMAIWEVLSVSWVGLLFGQGWGASFASPAVGNLYVTYSHSLLSYMFFKTGLIGLALTCLFLFEIGKQLFRLFCRNPVLANALFWALIIPVFFYASYKSLDFGLLLTLILLLVGSSRRNKDKVT